MSVIVDGEVRFETPGDYSTIGISTIGRPVLWQYKFSGCHEFTHRVLGRLIPGPDGLHQTASCKGFGAAGSAAVFASGSGFTSRSAADIRWTTATSSSIRSRRSGSRRSRMRWRGSRASPASRISWRPQPMVPVETYLVRVHYLPAGRVGHGCTDGGGGRGDDADPAHPAQQAARDER